PTSGAWTAWEGRPGPNLLRQAPGAVRRPRPLRPDAGRAGPLEPFAGRMDRRLRGGADGVLVVDRSRADSGDVAPAAGALPRAGPGDHDRSGGAVRTRTDLPVHGRVLPRGGHGEVRRPSAHLPVDRRGHRREP